MDIEFSLNKSVDENAGRYFDLAKKAKKKLEGAKKALLDSRKKLADLKRSDERFWQEEEKKEAKKQVKKEWYEKFHWFFSSEGFLCIGGKDATSNEVIIKKHLEKDDLVFHTDMAGSPFFIVKEGAKAGEKTREETAQAVACYSRAWKLGYTTADVFYVNPDQVTKETKPGEHIGKGSFMIYGKTNYLHPQLEYAIGLKDGQVIGGPLESIRSRTANFVVVFPGREKKGALSKKIKSKLKGGDLDDIDKFLPAGGGDLKK